MNFLTLQGLEGLAADVEIEVYVRDRTDKTSFRSKGSLNFNEEIVISMEDEE